jgi:hypothetical protein
MGHAPIWDREWGQSPVMGAVELNPIIHKEKPNYLVVNYLRIIVVPFLLKTVLSDRSYLSIWLDRDGPPRARWTFPYYAIRGGQPRVTPLKTSRAIKVDVQPEMGISPSSSPTKPSLMATPSTDDALPPIRCPPLMYSSFLYFSSSRACSWLPADEENHGGPKSAPTTPRIG